MAQGVLRLYTVCYPGLGASAPSGRACLMVPYDGVASLLNSWSSFLSAISTLSASRK